jgi:hypothetical protein
MREKDGSDIDIVLQQVPLGVAKLRPEDLLEVGYLYLG